MAVAGKGLRLPCWPGSCCWLPRSPSGAAGLRFAGMRAMRRRPAESTQPLRAPSPHQSSARAFPAQPPLPWLVPSALSDGAGGQGPAGRAKPGARGDRSENCRAAKQQPQLLRDACPRRSCTGEHLWACPCASPRFCSLRVLTSLPLRCHGLGMRGWQRALTVGLDLTGSCVSGRLLLSRASERV